MNTMADTEKEKTQVTVSKMDKLADYVSTLVADRVILVTKLQDIKILLISKTDIKINDIVKEINDALKAIDHRDKYNGRHTEQN
jgi:hypothetical protein